MRHDFIGILESVKGLCMIAKLQGCWTGGGGHCVLKWGFMQIFPGNQDATLKKMLDYVSF